MANLPTALPFSQTTFLCLLLLLLSETSREGKKGYFLNWVPSSFLDSLVPSHEVILEATISISFLLLISFTLFIRKFSKGILTHSSVSALWNKEYWKCWHVWGVVVLLILHQRCICYQYLQKFWVLTHVSQKSNTTCCHGVWAFHNSLVVFINIITTLQLKELPYPWVLRHLLQKKLSVSEPEGKPPRRCYQMPFLYCLCFSSIAEPSVLLK